MSHSLSASRVARACLSSALWVALASGCIESIVIDDQRLAATRPDAAADPDEEGDAADPIGEPDPGDEPTPDAARPVPPVMDGGAEPKPDAGRDAGRDAGSTPPADAGARPDASCIGARCDAGSETPPGPCASCGGVAVLVQPAGIDGADVICDNGSPTLCWTNPVGECTMQCPKTDSCTKDDPDACGPGRYCYFAKIDCGASSAGFCATVPKECSNLSVPICGCDGRIHQNTCVAALAGTAVYTGLASDHCK